MSFSQILNSVRGEAGHCQVDVGEDWSQGRATFGGVIAAVGNAVMRKFVPSDRPLRSLQTAFVGPASAGTWTVTAKVLRVGRAVTLVHCNILDHEQVAATQVGVYGSGRPSAVEFKPQPASSPRAVDELADVRYESGRMPAFLQHFAIRWAQGHPPFSGAPYEPSKVFIRHRDPSAMGESAVIALLDSIPTPVLSMFSAPTPASSLTWTLECFEHRFDFPASAWWRMDSTVDAATSGYVDQTAVLNDPDGQPVALSRQLFTVFG